MMAESYYQVEEMVGSPIRLTRCTVIVGKEADEYYRLKVLEYSRFGTAGISFLGALSIIIFSLLSKKMRHAEVHLLFNLSLADLFLSAAWLAGAVMFHYGDQQPCDLVSYIVWSLELTTHLLTVTYALITCVRLYEEYYARNRSSAAKTEVKAYRTWLNRVAYVIAWFLPAGLGLPRILHPPKMQRCTSCLMLWAAYSPDRSIPNITSDLTGDDGSQFATLDNSDELEGYANTVFVIILGLSMISLLICYWRAYYFYNRLQRGTGIVGPSDGRRMRDFRRRTHFYILVFFFCWTTALVVAIWVRVSDEAMNVVTDRGYILLLAQALTMPMQGFLNSLVYGWSRSSFRSGETINVKHRDYGTIEDTANGM